MEQYGQRHRLVITDMGLEVNKQIQQIQPKSKVFLPFLVTVFFVKVVRCEQIFFKPLDNPANCKKI